MNACGGARPPILASPQPHTGALKKTQTHLSQPQLCKDREGKQPQRADTGGACDYT